MSTLNCHNWYELIEIVGFVEKFVERFRICANNLEAYRVRPVHKEPCHSNISVCFEVTSLVQQVRQRLNVLNHAVGLIKGEFN